MLTTRELTRAEIAQIWTIDRSEVIDGIYYQEADGLVLRPEHFDLRGWPPGETERYTAHLMECFDRGGWFCGVFDGDALIAVAVLDPQPLGPRQDQRQLKFLHVSAAYRHQGHGRRLFELAAAQARAAGARQLYISATPSENTIRFYLSLGGRVTQHPDPGLFALEPEDIHLECDL